MLFRSLVPFRARARYRGRRRLRAADGRHGACGGERAWPQVEVSTRKSLFCNAKWTTVVNQKVTPQYIGGSVYFLMNGYQPHFSERSAGPVDKDYRIYTNMVGDASRDVKSCGRGAPYSLVSLPVSGDNYCVGTVK